MEEKNKKSFSKKGRTIVIASLFVLFFSGAGLYYYIFSPDWSWLKFGADKNVDQTASVGNASSSPAVPENICVNCQPRWLDGVAVPAEKAAAFPVAIMIDNDVLARPQAGLSQASLVFEAPVEGGMTRYLAIFPADADLAAVGPVRSARPYFVSWAEELHALYIHCGGSQEALAQLKKASLYDLNEFYNSRYFWRENSGRTAPHNLLTSGDNWRSYLNERGLAEDKAAAWLFKEEGEHASSSPDINLRFSDNFRALWRYQAATNDYQRFFNGDKGRDEGADIKAKNIIIHYLDSQIVDDYGRLRLGVTGNGRAKICLDGVCQPGVWKKSGSERTRYYYADGEEVKFNPGITWIEVADENTAVD